MGKSRKRKSASDHVESGKRHRFDAGEPLSGGSHRDGRSFQPRSDPTTGQHFFVPGLEEDATASDLEAEPVDGLSYLKQVRFEARGIPSLLVAPSNDTATDTVYKQPTPTSIQAQPVNRYLYSDGAYMALPLEDEDEDDNDEFLSELDSEVEGTPKDGDHQTASHLSAQSTGDRQSSSKPQRPQVVFTAILRDRMRLLRDLLGRKPPQSATLRLSPEQPITCPLGQRAWQKWDAQIRDVDPVPAQIAAMDRENALRVLDICSRKLRSRELTGQQHWLHEVNGRGHFGKRFGGWVISLLARLGDVGTLDNESVAIVRDLGKSAMDVLVGLGHSGTPSSKTTLLAPEPGDGTLAQEPSELLESPTQDAIQDGTESSCADNRQGGNQPTNIEIDPAANGEATGCRPPAGSDWMLRATLEMIITIVSEDFGQRDLAQTSGGLFTGIPPLSVGDVPPLQQST